jgi:hypothetical protein
MTIHTEISLPKYMKSIEHIIPALRSVLFASNEATNWIDITSCCHLWSQATAYVAMRA